MKSRDKQIINDLQRFRVMDRDSIEELYFQGLKRPSNSANNVLKRLYRDGHIDRSTNYTPYLYFPADSKMKKMSQKIPHFLKILQAYKDMRRFEKPHTFLVEPKYGAKGTVEPDAFAFFNKTVWFLEIQNTQYSEEVMKKKLDRYVKLYEDGTLHNEPWQPRDQKVFPHVLIISDTRYALDQKYPFKVFQTTSIPKFMESLKKKPAVPKREESRNGGINIKIG